MGKQKTQCLLILLVARRGLQGKKIGIMLLNKWEIGEY